MKYQRLRDLREDKDMTQTQVAEYLKTTQSYYGQYERGEIEIPFDRVISLAKLYNVSLDYIAGLTNDKRGIGYSSNNVNSPNITINYK